MNKKKVSRLGAHVLYVSFCELTASEATTTKHNLPNISCHIQPIFAWYWAQTETVLVFFFLSSFYLLIHIRRRRLRHQQCHRCQCRRNKTQNTKYIYNRFDVLWFCLFIFFLLIKFIIFASKLETMHSTLIECFWCRSQAHTRSLSHILLLLFAQYTIFCMQ